MTDLNLAIAGATGRMGQVLVRLIGETAGLALAGALTEPRDPAMGKDAGALAGLEPVNVPVTASVDDALRDVHGIVDFSSPDATVALARTAAEQGQFHIIGTTGLTGAQDRDIAKAAERTPIVYAGNFSLGVNLLVGLAEKVAAALDESFDIEVVEMHHRMKRDAPSGTALMLGEGAARGRGKALNDIADRGRDGLTGARDEGHIGFAALRGGTVVGEHTVIFAGPSERIELTHRAEDRSIFARGALTAARWAHGRSPGLYAMADVLGLS